MKRPVVSLRTITATTVRAVTDLAVNEEQQHLVASNAVSLAEALFAQEAWYRAIYADDELIGFVMLYDESLRDAPPAEPRVGLWRFMIDRRFQAHGYGSDALQLVIQHVKALGVHTLLELSFVPGPNSPERFYLRHGFRSTGRMDEGEVVLELPLR